jgi:hypothetical protein
MLLFSFMAYRSPLKIRVGLVANPDTPPFSNRHHPVSGIARLEFANCLEEISRDQAIAMIDKAYIDHPEKWSNPLGGEIVMALSFEGGPCQRMNPFSNYQK